MSPRLGGGHGANPRSLLAAVFAPPRGGCHGPGGLRDELVPGFAQHPLANRGNHGNRTLANSANTLPLGVGPKAHGPPLLGGGNTLARGSRGEYLPGCSLVSSQDGPHIGVLVGTSQESWENSILDIRVSLPWLLVHMGTGFFFRNRPPEELDNKRSSTRRGEFDSSTPEVIGVLLGQIFLA